MEETQEFENFYNPDYSFNVEVPKGMKDDYYRDYTFRLNNGITPDERLKYYKKNIPYAEGLLIAGRKKEIKDNPWAEGGKSLANAALYASTGLVKGLNTIGRNAAATLVIDDNFKEDYYKTHKQPRTPQEKIAYEKAREEWYKRYSNAVRDVVTPDEDTLSGAIENTIKNAEFELKPQKRWSLGWWLQNAGNVGAPLLFGLAGGIIPEMATSYGFGNYADTNKKILEGGGSLLEADRIAALSGSLETALEYATISKYVTKLGMPRVQRYGRRFLVGSGQEVGQSAKDMFLLRDYDTRSKDEKEEEIMVALIFGGLGEALGLAIRDIQTRGTQKDIVRSAKKEGMSDTLAKDVALTATVDESPDYERLQEAYREEGGQVAKARLEKIKGDAYDMLVDLGNDPEMAAVKVSAAVGDLETQKSQVIEDLKKGTYLTQEEKDKLLADFEEAINEGGEDAGKLLELREMITDMAQEKGLPEDEYVPAAKINSLIGLRTWKVYNENSGMTWEQFLGDKQVADVILREAIGENPVFGLEQYGIANPTDAQIERAAIMEENGASEEEIRATLQDMGEVQKLFSRTIEKIDLTNQTDFTEYANNPEKAIDKLLNEKSGYVSNAMYKEGIGYIDFIYGKRGKDGYGLAHIIERRERDNIDIDRFIRQIPNIINDGSVYTVLGQKGRKFVISNDKEVIIRLDLDGEQKNWLLTAYMKKSGALPLGLTSEQIRSDAQTPASNSASGENITPNNENVKLFSRVGYASMRNPLEGNALSTSHYGEGEGGHTTHGYGNYILFDKEKNKWYYYDRFSNDGRVISYKGQDLRKGVQPKPIQRIYNQLYGKNKVDKEKIKETLDRDEKDLKNAIKGLKEQYKTVEELYGEEVDEIIPKERKEELDAFIKQHNEGLITYSEMKGLGKNHLEERYMNYYYQIRMYEEFLQEIKDARKLNLDDFKIGGTAQQWAVNVPESEEMLQEEDVLSKQPEQVRQALEKMNKQGKAKGFLDSLRTYRDDNNIDGYDIYGKIMDYTGSEKAASELLLENGIKGIEYYGERDGHGAVIFEDVPVIERLLSRNQGAYTPVSRIIELAKVHTPDTFLHEVSHNFFINYFDAIERIADKNSDYVKQAQAVYDLVGKKSSAEFTDYDWETITQSMVKYLHTGDAPSLATKNVFDRAKNWVISIYNDIARENPVSPEMKEFFDSLVSEEQDLTGINELHDRIGDVLRVLNGAKTGKEAAISGKDKQDIDLLLRALNARRPRAGKTLAQEIRQYGGIDIDSELAKTLGYDPKKKNPIFRKGGIFEKIDEIEDYLRDKGIYNFPDAETAEQVAKKEEDIIDIIQNADMTYSQNERYQEDLREVVAQNQAAAQKVLGEIMDREGLKNLNEVEDLLLKARKQMDTRGKDIIAVNKNAIKYIESSMYQAKRDLGRIMKEQNNARYNYQQKLKDVIRGLPISYKNKEKLMGNIARVSNKETFDKVAPQVIETAKKYADMEEKNLYRDMIKTWLSGTYQRGVKNKRFTYEGNKLFDELRSVNRLTKEQAEEALLDRIQKTTEDVLTPSELMVRRLLQYKTLGADMSLENIEELALDLGGMIEADIKSRQQFDEMKGLITKKNVEDLANRIETLKPSSKALLVLSVKNGDFYSIMNELGGKEFADKFNMRVPFAEQELYLQKRLNSAIKQGAEIYGVTPNHFIDVVQELSEKKYTITPIDNYGEDQISKMEIMHILLGMRQKDTKDLILHAYEEFDENGVQLTNQIGDLIANLDVKDIQFASMLQREIAKDYDEENKAYIFRNGVDMPHLENYFPRKSRSGEKGEEEIDAYNNLALQIPSFYKMRGKNSVPVFQNVWTTFKTHKADASYAIKVFPKYLELYKVMHSPKIQHLIKTKYGADILKDVNSMLNSMGAKAYNGIYSSMNGLVAKAAGNWIKAKIGINPAIFAKQLISVTNYAENMPIGEYLGNMGYAATHPKEAYKLMQDVAGDFINTRFKLGRQNEVLSRQMATTDDTKKGILKSSTAQNIDDVITLTVRAGDIAPIIYGGYARVKYLMDKEGKTKEQAREIFIDETLRSQQASSAPTTSNFQKQGGFTKLLTAFQNTPFQYARILAEARTMHRRGDISGKQYYKTLFNYMIVQPFLLALAANGFYNLFHDDDKDKDLVSLSDVGLGAATSWLGGVPLISNVAQSAVQVATGEQPYGISIGLIEDINKAFQKARKKEKTNWDYIDVITPFVEIGTGKPLGVIKRYTKKIVD